MKRLSLKELKLESNEILQREQLLTISGGDCFDWAISETASMENNVTNGYGWSDSQHSYWMNVNYGACVCNEIYEPIGSITLYDACWG